MKCILLGLLVLATALALAVASEPGSVSECKSFSDLAATMMKARQNGVPMSQMMDPDGDGEPVAEGYQSMIVMAFEEPRYSTPQMQQRAIVDFQNEIHLMCVKARMK